MPLIVVIALSIVLAIALALLVFLLLPTLRVKLLYQFTVHGRENVPRSGACLIVCNHVTLLDRLLLRADSPRRLKCVRFNDPQLIVKALERGKAVLMFPEGERTKSGHLLPLTAALGETLARASVDLPVIPAAIDGLWGSMFSCERGCTIWKRPRAFRPVVGVMFGPPISPSSGEGNPVAEIRQAVQDVMAACAVKQSEHAPLVHRAFVRNAVKFRNLFRPCVVDNAAGEKILTWGKTFVGAMCTTDYLRHRLGEEKHVGIWLPTGLGDALANLSLAFLGKASVNLNYTAGADAVRSAARQAGLRTVITARRFVLRFSLDLPEEIERIYLEDVLAASTRGQRIRHFLTALFLPGWYIDRLVLGLNTHRVDDVLTIVFSSGSTGEPKGVVLTHRNIGSNVDSAVRTIGIHREDKLFGVLPMFHSFGYTVCLWAPLVAGATVIYYPDPRGAKEVGMIVKKHRATLMLSTATFLRFYLRRCDADDFRSLRLLICGAEKLPVKLQDEFLAKFGVLPLEGYGCTELSPVVSVNMPDVGSQICNIRGTVGQPIIGISVRAFTQETREPLPPGVEGLLCAIGPNVMAGYLDQPEKTALAVKDGWYNTGDVGLVQANGFIKITGRVSRFAKIAGEMVPLERVEEEMLDLLGGADRTLALTAVQCEKRGERLIVLHLPELDGKLGDLLAALPARGIPNLWIPDVRDCFIVEALPALGSGKLDLKRVGELAHDLARRETRG